MEDHETWLSRMERMARERDDSLGRAVLTMVNLSRENPSPRDRPQQETNAVQEAQARR